MFNVNLNILDEVRLNARRAQTIAAHASIAFRPIHFWQPNPQTEQGYRAATLEARNHTQLRDANVGSKSCCKRGSGRRENDETVRLKRVNDNL